MTYFDIHQTEGIIPFERVPDSVWRDSVRIDHLVAKNPSFATFVTISMAPILEKWESPRSLYANINSHRFYKRLESHLGKVGISKIFSWVILDYLYMPGSYGVERYLGTKFGLLEFFVRLATKNVVGGMSLAVGGCIVLPLTPAVNEKILMWGKFTCIGADYEIERWDESQLCRHPLIESDLEISDKISQLGKNVREYLGVLGCNPEGKSRTDRGALFLVLVRTR